MPRPSPWAASTRSGPGRAAGRAASDYPKRNVLTRQTPQTVLIAGISLLLGVCVLATLLGGAGAETAAGLFIICGGPLALFVIGTGIVLLLTRERTDRF